MTIWVDVEDIFEYFRFNPHPSGIQRVAVAIIRALVSGGSVRIVRHADENGLLQEVRWDDVEAMLATPPAPERNQDAGPIDDIEHRTKIQRRILRMAPELRGPLFRAGVLQSQVLHNVRALARATRPPSLELRAMPGGAGVAIGAQPVAGDAYLVLGAPWSVPGALTVLRQMKDRGLRVGLLIHDVIPVRRPEWQAPDKVAHFRAWLEASLAACDTVLTLSRFTARDVASYARERGIAIAPVTTVSAGTTAPPVAGARPAGFPPPGSYVLYVSTLEARKNHALVVRVWQKLMAEVRAGTRLGASVPMLVFAGRVGMGVADLMQQLDNSRWLNGRIRLYRDPTDAELRALYEGCRFTVIPSLYEGWGLPLQESLLLGKPCLAAGNTSLPEAGGTLCRYFDPEEGGEAHAAVAGLLDDAADVAAWQDAVRAEFGPRSWDEAARAIRAALAA